MNDRPVGYGLNHLVKGGPPKFAQRRFKPNRDSVSYTFRANVTSWLRQLDQKKYDS
jgi:hypothetical protein